MFTKFEDLPVSELTIIAFEIDRSDILEKNAAPFLEFWNIDRIARAGRLHDMFGKIAFCLGGYDDDERALFEIPEARIFLRRLVEQWPYFFYADCLKAGFLSSLLLCLLPTLTVKVDDHDRANYRANLNIQETNEAFRKLLDGFVRICPLDPQMTQPQLDARIAAVQKYLAKGFIGNAG